MASPTIVVRRANAIPSENTVVSPAPPPDGICEKTCTKPVTVPSKPSNGAAETTTSSRKKPLSWQQFQVGNNCVGFRWMDFPGWQPRLFFQLQIFDSIFYLEIHHSLVLWLL